MENLQITQPLLSTAAVHCLETPYAETAHRKLSTKSGNAQTFTLDPATLPHRTDQSVSVIHAIHQ